jgi:hypothetical protein
MPPSVSLPRTTVYCALAGVLIAATSLAGRTVPVQAVTQTHSPAFGTRSIGAVELPLSATGGSGPYVWSLQSGTLPPGIAIRTDLPASFPGSASAGLIGVATTPGTYNFTLRVSSNGETADVASTMTITALTVQGPATLPDAFVGTPYSYTLPALGSGGPVTFASTGAMPAGLSLSAGGVLAGTPTAAASSFSIPYSVSDGTDTVTRTMNLTVSPISISATSLLAPGVLPNATQNVAYSVTLTAAGGAGGYSFSASGIPSGLNFNGATGEISGTLNENSTTGKFLLNVTVTDSLGASYSRRMSLTVVAPVVGLPALAPSGASFDGCTLGVSCTRSVVVQTGGVAPFTWAATGLPAGMAMRTGGGVTGNNTTPGDAELWGTPTVSGLFNVQMTVTDATGATATNTFPLRISTILQTNSLSQGADGVIDTPFNRALRVIGGTQPYTVSQVSGILSAGLTIDANTLVVSGTPTESGNFSPRLLYTDAGGQLLQLTNSYTISSAGLGITINSDASLGSVLQGAFFSRTLSATGAAAITWSVIGGALPEGVTLGSNGFLSGSPSTGGIFTFLARAASTSNPANYGARQFTVNVTPISFSIPSPLPYGNVGTEYSHVFTATGGAGAKTWTLGSFSYLPPGLLLAADGTLSGTPTATGLFTFVVMVSDTANNTRSATLTLSIYPNGVVPPVGATHPADFGTRSIGYLEIPLSAAGGSGAYVWSLQGGALPPGMVIRTDKPSFFPSDVTAGLSGLATTPGNYSFTLRVTSGGVSSDQAATLRITALTVKDLHELPAAFVGTPYSYGLTALGNAGPVTWTALDGLPAGMSLSSGGVLTGTPAGATDADIKFSLTDGTDTVLRTIRLQVLPLRVSVLGAIAPGVFPNATQDVPYSATVAASGGSGGYIFTAQGLPAGLSLNPATGVISGTVPSASNGDNGPGVFTVDVTTTDSSDTAATIRLSLTVMPGAPQLPAIAPFGSPFDDCSLGVPCDRGAAPAAGTAPFSWTVSGLPSGMSYRTGGGVTTSSYAPGTVQLWGTPTVTGSFNVTLTVTDATGATATRTFPLFVSALVQTNFLRDGRLNVSYGRTLRIVGGTRPYGTATHTQVDLPTGLSFNSSGVSLTGTPTESGHFSTLVTFTDAGGQTLRMRQYLFIEGAGNGNVALEDIDDPYLAIGVPVSESFGCCATPLVVSVLSGTTPPGLTFASDGTVSGTPTTSGAYTFTLQATDGQNAANFAVRQYTLYVTPLVITNASLPSGTIGVPYSQSLTVTGGTGAVTFALAPFAYVPSGLALGANGTVSGTPTATGQYSFMVTVSDEAGNTLTAEATLSVYASGVSQPPLDRIDLNGDGGGDAFLYHATTGNWSRQISQSDGFVEQSQGTWSPGWSVSPANFNGDGLTDFFLYNTTSGEWSKMITDSTGFTSQATGGWWPGWERYVIELNGDGISDFFLYDPATGVWFKCVSTPTGFDYTQGGWNPGWELYPMRLNDDTYGDLFLISRETGRWFWALGQNGPSFTYPVTETWFPGWQFYPGDFNGDGLSDVLLHDPPTGTYFVAQSNGAGFGYQQGGWSLGWFPYAADLDADGKDDLFLHDPATGVWFQMVSDGAGNFTNVGGQTWSLGWNLYPTDLNGDARTDIVLYDPATGTWYQARNLTNGSFTYYSGTWATGYTVITRAPIR